MNVLVKVLLDARALASHLLAFVVSLVLAAQLFDGGKLSRDAYIQAGVTALISMLVHWARPDDTAAQQAEDVKAIKGLIETFAPVIGAKLTGLTSTAPVMQPDRQITQPPPVTPKL